MHPLDILCVEDNPYGRVVLNTMLTELGHRADFVGTGAAAIDAVAHRPYDVVLMDVTLPDIDGVEATRRIRALPGSQGRIAIVGVSGRAKAADEAAGRAAGMNGYLTKPLSPSGLTQVLGSLEVARMEPTAGAKRPADDSQSAMRDARPAQKGPKSR